MTSACVVISTVAVILFLRTGQAEAGNYFALVGDNITVSRPSRPYRYTEYFLYRDMIQQSANTGKFVMNANQLVIVDTTLEDAGGYKWRASRAGYNDRFSGFDVYVLDYIRARVIDRLVASLNKTLLCECRFKGPRDYGLIIPIWTLWSRPPLALESQMTTSNNSYHTTKRYYRINGMLGKSFRCAFVVPTRTFFSENITVGIIDHLRYAGSTFNTSANVSDDRYMGLNINDIPVLAGNQPDFLIPDHSENFQVTSQGNENSTLVTLSVANVTYTDSGIYRWYFFGQGTLGRVSLVIAEPPQLITPTRAVAGETVQLKCSLRYYDGNARATNNPKLLMHSFIDEDPLPLQNEIENRYSNYREITQTYELHVCADHHLQKFVCRVQLVTNPQEIFESATNLHVFYPPTWVDISPRSLEYLVDTTLVCQADTNPPPEYFWTNTKTNERVNGSKLLLGSSFVDETESRWECTAINNIDGVEWNVTSTILFRTVAVQNIVLPGPRLVRTGTFVTLQANLRMLTRDFLAIENNDKALVALGGPYSGSFGQDKYVLSKYRQFATLLIRNAALNDSGSYRWSVFGTLAVARTNVIVTEEPGCSLSTGLTVGQVVNLTCHVRFGIGTTPAIPEDEHPQVIGLLAGLQLVPQSTAVELFTNGTVVHTQVFSEMAVSQWHQQTFTCRLTLPNAMDEMIETSITLDVTGR